MIESNQKSNIYKQCDIRGIYGTDLLDSHALRLGAVVPEIYGKLLLAVGGDGRKSTPTLKSILTKSLLQSCCNVVDLGILPTPAFYFAVQKLGLDGGIMVTASHNPAAYNGFKMIFGTLPITSEQMQQLSLFMETYSPANKQTEGIHGCLSTADILPEYTQFACRHSSSLAGMKVVLDCGNGVTGTAARSIWGSTGADVSILFEDVDGDFPNHPANPATERNLSSLKTAVIHTGAEFGVAYDGDGDRVGFVDHLGRMVPHDKAIVLFIRHSLEHEIGPVIYDQKCSLIVPETIQAMGGIPIREKSGHTFMKRRFIVENALYAGEISGHHFFRSLHGDDGIIASLIMAQYIQNQRKPLSTLVDEIPTYHITPDIRAEVYPHQARKILAELEKNLSGETRLCTIDGVRADWEDGWGLARISVTEPVMTFRFEGKTKSALRRIVRCFIQADPDLQNLLQDSPGFTNSTLPEGLR